MSWRDDLREASFRNVAFHVDQGSLVAGRRLARHEYPQRDIPYLEDMGRKAREYKVDAFVLGDDYRDQRDALIKAIESEGAGQLVHPHYGTVRVTVADCTITESTAQGGLAKFSISFVEAGEQNEPGSDVDTESVLDDQYGQCQGDFAADFADQFSVDGLPDYAVQDAYDAVGSLLDDPAMALGDLAMIRANPLSELGSLLPENLLASLANPMALAAAILALIDVAASFVTLFDFSAPQAGGSMITPTRLAVADNSNAITNIVQQAATARRVSDLAKSAPPTADDAMVARAEIVSRVDAVLFNEATGDRAAQSLIQLRTEAMAHFLRLQPNLPRIVRVTPLVTRPALVLAHDFFGDDWLDQAREDEILQRNHIRHPGFVPAGQSVELIA